MSSPSPTDRAGTRKLSTLDHLVASLLAGAYLVILVGTAHDLGFSRDEGFYFRAADSYTRWVELLLEDPARAITQPEVDRAWRVNHEHPPLMKTLFGLSHAVLHEKLGLFEERSTSYRFPGMVAGALILWMLYLFGTQAYGRVAGAFAAGAFALAPRPFYHSHLACFDIAITAATLAVVYAYWRSLVSHRWGLATGLVFGIALLTKLNAFFLPLTLLVHYGVFRLRGFRLRRRQPGDVLGLPVAGISMAFVGPAMLFAAWPWLWFDTVRRFERYLGFHSGHPYYNIEYLGVTWFEPPLPISYPLGMTAFTWPLTTLVLFSLGLFAVAGNLLPAPLRRRLAPGAAPDARRTDFLVAWCVLVPIAIIAYPSIPIFGGTKHWLTAMPFLCLLAGVGFQRAAAALLGRTRRPLARALAAAGLAAALLAGPAIETRASHPFGLSHYTALAGGTAGAADIGLCRQFWGFTTGSLTGWLNERVRSHGAVQFHDTTFEAYRMLTLDGRLRRDIRYGRKASTSDFALVHLEQHWSELEYAIWDDYGSAVPVHVLEHEGVPIVPVYARPRDPR